MNVILQIELLHHFKCEHLSRGIAGGGLDFHRPKTIDDYAKDGGSEVVCHLCSFTKILCGRNFSVW